MESITVKGAQTHRRYSRRSLDEFVGTLAKSSAVTGNSDTTLRQAMKAVWWPYGNSAIALVYVSLFPFNLIGVGPHHLDWRDAICVADVDHFHNELPRLAERFGAGGIHITKSGVMNRLRCSNATFDSLVCRNLLRPAKGPLKHHRFLVSDVEAFRKKYVLLDEAASTFGFKSPKQAFFMATRLGMRPKYAWGSNMPLLFERSDFERVRSALN
ncbi:lambda repressor-like predicted transcriptional regulator [Devosia sp. 2618]